MSKLEIKQSEFYLDGKILKIHSGGMHYFRTMPDEWEDRLLKLKKCGLNTVETYVPWNMHEPQEGQFCFEGMADIEAFIKLATDLGLYVIIRPGPYICAEWEFGGLPWWLLKYKGINLRSMDEVYLQKVDNYFDVLIPMIVPYLITNGGNVIAVQIENEYGSYGTDKEYLSYIKDAFIKRGIDALLFTSDGPSDFHLTGGYVEGVLPTVNFGSKPEKHFENFAKRFPQYPKMCMEYWDGWFDHWGYEHITRDAQEVADDITTFVRNGWSFNLYMFHGGTNFGFWNGANLIDGQGYRPTATTYDYDALLSESGEPTEKYFKVKNVLNPDDKTEYNSKNTANLGTFELTKSAALFDNLDILSKPVKSSVPKTFEELNTGYGFVLYRTVVKAPRGTQTLRLLGLHDRGQIFVDGKEEAVYYRGGEYDQIDITADKDKNVDILVENLGRVNYGPHLKDEKGILGGVFLGEDYGSFQHGFVNYPIDFSKISDLKYQNLEKTDGPVFLSGSFEIDSPQSTFIKLDGFTKGVVFINGFNLGRYWDIGPQKELYVPKGVLRKGSNEIVIFELHKGSNTIEFVADRTFKSIT